MKVVEHKVSNEHFEGSVSISVPSYSERLRLMKSLNFKVAEDGKVEANEDTLEKIACSVDKLSEHVKSVSIKVKSSGESINSLDDLGVYQEGAQVLSDLTVYLTRGLTLGNA